MHDVGAVATLEAVVAGIAAGDEEDVVAGAAPEVVAAGTADDHVIAGTPRDGVVAQAAVDQRDPGQFGGGEVQRVAAAGAGDDINAAAAVYLLDRGRAGELVHADRVVAIAALHDVDAVAAVEAVVTGIAAGNEEDVVAGAALEVVAAGTADDHVIAGAAGDGVVAQAAVDQGHTDEVACRIIHRIAAAGTAQMLSDRKIELGLRGKPAIVGSGHAQGQHAGVAGTGRAAESRGCRIEGQPGRQGVPICQRGGKCQCVAGIAVGKSTDRHRRREGDVLRR